MPWSLFPTKRPTLSKTSLDLLLLLGLLLLFYSNPLLSPSKTSYGGDGLSLFTPSVAHYCRSMYLGKIPLWNSYNWLGAPFLAAYQSAVLYPPQIIGLFFRNPETALNFGIFLSLLWLSYGAYFFGLRALQLERSPSLLMAICLSCGGFVGGHMDHVNQLAAISWIPWIMCEALLVLRHPRLKYMILLALCLGMQLLAGHPQYVIYTLAYLFGLALIYYVYYHHRRKISDPPAWIGIVLLGVGILAGVGLASAQILPSAELSKRSLRQLDNPERMFNYSFPPRNLITILYPYAYGNPVNGLHTLDGTPLLDGTHLPDGTEVTATTPVSALSKLLGMFENDKWVREAGIGSELDAFKYHEWVCYVGLITVALALLAIITMFQEFVVRCFLFLALLVLVLAAGSYVDIATPPYRLLVACFPGGEHLRVPARLMILFNLSVVVLAAMGFNQVVFYLRERRRIPESTLALLRLLILVLVFFDLYLFSLNQTFRYNDSTQILREKGPALTFLDENPGEYRVFRQMGEVPYDTDGERIALRMAVKRPAPRLQVQRFQPNLNILSRIQVDGGYEEGLLPTLSYWNFERKFRRNLRGPEPDTFLMGLMNIKYLITDVPYSPKNAGKLKHILRYVTPVMGRLGASALDNDVPLEFRPVPENIWPASPAESERFYALYENLNFCPKFLWEERLRRAFDLGALEVTDRTPDLSSYPSVPSVPDMTYRLPWDFVKDAKPAGPTMRDLLDETYNFNARRANGSPNAFTLEKPTDDSGNVVMIEAAYPGWICKWNGHTEPLKRINAVMMGCHLPKGATAFSFAFEPYSYRIGFFLSCCFVLFLSTIVFFLDFPRKPLFSRKR
jgi:hypothetical protein